METGGNMQHTIKFFRDLQAVNPPTNAPENLLRQVTSEVQAMQVSMRCAGFKQGYFAARCHCSPGYFSKLVTGKNFGINGEPLPLPEWFVVAFCWATGNNLLEQYQNVWCRKDKDAQLIEQLAAQLRRAA